MFDLTQPVTYRSFALNDAVTTSGQIVGCRLEGVTVMATSGIGYVEKRSQDDGLDASDVYLGGRRLRLRGTMYGTSRGDAFDRLDDLRAALTPTLAYADDNAGSGYLPLLGAKATARTDEFPSGYISLYINVRPLATLQTDLSGDNSGGLDTVGFGIPWVAEIEAKDPRFYGETAKTVDISGDTSGSGTLDNTGTYPTPLTFLLYADTDNATIFNFVGLGADVSLEIPALTGGACLLTLDGHEKVALLTYGGQELLRMDLLATDGATQFPSAPAGGGGAYAWTLSNSNLLLEGSIISYHEAYI